MVAPINNDDFVPFLGRHMVGDVSNKFILAMQTDLCLQALVAAYVYSGSANHTPEEMDRYALRFALDNGGLYARRYRAIMNAVSNPLDISTIVAFEDAEHLPHRPHSDLRFAHILHVVNTEWHTQKGRFEWFFKEKYGYTPTEQDFFHACEAYDLPATTIATVLKKFDSIRHFGKKGLPDIEYFCEERNMVLPTSSRVIAYDPARKVKRLLNLL
jgi:hypothetical protein